MCLSMKLLGTLLKRIIFSCGSGSTHPLILPVGIRLSRGLNSPVYATISGTPCNDGCGRTRAK